MSESQQVTTKNGTVKTVVADNKADLAEAVKVTKAEEAPVYPNINHPVQKGHDMVAVDGDVNKVLVNGEGAHNSPLDAIDEKGNERGDPEVEAVGLSEPAYKTVPVFNNDEAPVVEATKEQVAAAKKDSKPANEVN